MADSPSQEALSWSDAEINQMADTSQQLIRGINIVTGRTASELFRILREARQLSENHMEIEVVSRDDGRETRELSENHEEMVGVQTESEEARSLVSEDQPISSPLIFEDDTMVNRPCYEHFRLEKIDNLLRSVSAGESDRCSICHESYSTTSDAPTVVRDMRYCSDCRTSFTMKPDTDNSHTACAVPKCLHVFGRYCIIQWFMDSSTCPLCRSEVDIE
ncbi:hypothetical protein BOTNAR_0232g00160 [Botryotinia narcissicola]|uniref:RING-type domain-containing protein n=1 Tax=Botryotinia narcissicola TaxID=278944 RepID=A0A4Z1I2T2_9HELO|nr:hypothetical protein BOTNAR_0232g00160 [Botryotinia narcissicola]